MAKKRVAVALSGGVDSSVAASLLQDIGYEVIGITMRLWVEETGREKRQKSKQVTQHVDEAKQVCLTLGIPFHVIDLEDAFKRRVVDPFCQEYQRGRTPNPCVVCNRHIKFSLLLEHAISLGADYMATGHYARIKHSHSAYHLLKAVDQDKDQSYVLYTLKQAQLAHLLFPVGNYHGTKVREIARQKRLPTADKSSSQDICFITTDYSTFLSRYYPATPGEISDNQGNVLGKHKGTAFYTIGQRHGLGIATTKPVYVSKIEPEANRIIIAREEELFSSNLFASDVTWISGKAPREPMTVHVKVRYRSPEVAATIYPKGNSVEVRFQKPQRAIAPGQSVVFYNDNEVIGGGIIDK